MSHTDHQMAQLCDIMTSGHPSIPSTFPLSLTYYPLIAPNYHMTLLPLMAGLEERKILVCAVWKSTRLGLDACWPAGTDFQIRFQPGVCFKFFFV
jgi:hypothetical protein